MAVEKKVVIEFEFLASQGLEAIEQTKKQILDLKTQKEVLKLQNKEETKEYALLDAQLKNLNKTLKSQQSALEANLKAIEANDGSLKSMREQLKSLVTAYDSLGKAERESESGQALAQKIAGLTQEIKDLEYETERYGRNVGNYGNSIQEALSIDTTPLKTQLRQLTSELQALTLQQRQLKDTMSQTTDPAEYAKLEEQYNKLGAAIQDTATKAGMLKDTVEDTGKVISAQADDYPAISALNEGITALVDSYTVLKGVTTALGIENDRLLDVMAKVQVLQQSVNALNRIAIALDKAKNGSLAIQQTGFWKLVTAKMADRKASLAQAKANATLTASEGAATVGANGLRKAMIALKASFMSIPGVGWITAAAAALTALTVKIVKARKEAKDMDNQIREMTKDDPLNQIYASAGESIRKTSVELSACANMALRAANGSKEQEYWVRKVAEQTGLSYEYLLRHMEVLPNIVKQYIAMAKARAAFEKGVEAQVGLENVSDELDRVISKIQSFYDNRNIKKYQKATQDYLKNGVSDAFKATDAYRELWSMANKGQEQFFSTMKSWMDDQRKNMDQLVQDGQNRLEELGNDMTNITTEYNRMTTGMTSRTISSSRIAAKTVETIWSQLYKETLPRILADFDKQTEEMFKGMDESMRNFFEGQRYLERENVITNYLNDSRKVAQDLIEDLERALDLIGNIQGKKEIEGIKWPWEEEDKKNETEEKLRGFIKDIQKIISGSPQSLELDAKLNWSSNDWEANFEELERNSDFLYDIIHNLQDDISTIEKTFEGKGLGLSPEVVASYNKVLGYLQESLNAMERNKYYNEEILPVIKEVEGVVDSISKNLEKGNLEIDTESFERLSNLYKTLSGKDLDLMVNVVADETSLQKAKNELEAAEKTYKAIFNMPEKVKVEMGEGWNEELAKAENAWKKAQANYDKISNEIKAKQINNDKEAADNRTKVHLESFIAIGQAANDAFGSLSQMFDQLAEQDSRYAKFSKAFALMQILTSTAISIASAVQGATTAGAATGPAAIATTPAFIVEMIAIVLSAIAQATSLLSQAKMPHYAHGGYVDRGTTSKADDVHAMVSKGEYIVQADAVKMYGKDYFDSLNAGLVRGDMDISNALRAALEDMPAPIVSVKEINNMQSRVRVKEDISRGKIN